MSNHKLSRLEDGTLRIDLVITWSQITAQREKVIDSLVQTTEIKGFRKGKAPRNLVAQNSDSEMITNEAVKTLISTEYVKAIQELDLKPIVLPTVHIDSSQDNSDWELHAFTCELPLATLTDYKELLKKEHTAGNLWVPGKEDTASSTPSSSDQKISQTIDWLLKNIEIQIPNILVEAEANHMLTNLLDQINSLGLTVDSYLESKKMTKEELRSDFAQKARDNLKIEFILNQIAQEENIQTSDEDLTKWISSADKTTAGILENESQKSQLRQVLTRRRTLDFLSSLA